MRKPYLMAALAASVLSTSLVAAQGVPQQPVRTAPAATAAPARGGAAIALIDISYVFKKHTRFQAMMNDMKADVERAEQRMKAEQEAIKKIAERLGEFNKGTPDYKALTEEITKRRADMGVQIQLQKEEFLQREAKIYYNVYQEISQEVDYLAQANGIALVLKFNGDPADVQKPETVIQAINKDVVWYARNLDITPTVLERLNGRALNPGPADQRSRPGVTLPR